MSSIIQFFSLIKVKSKVSEYSKLDRTNILAGIDKDANRIMDDINLYISKQGVL